MDVFVSRAHACIFISCTPALCIYLCLVHTSLMHLSMFHKGEARLEIPQTREAAY